MQENTEPKKTEGSEVPEEETETNSKETLENNPTDSSQSDVEFEEHDGEILQPEKKKNTGYGFLILIILFLTGGSGYLYYTDRVPTKAAQLIKPILNKLNLPLVKVEPSFPTAEKLVSEVNKQSPPQEIQEEAPTPEKETVTEIAPRVSEDKMEKHISGSQSGFSKQVIESDNNAKISGTSTEVNQAKMEEIKETEEPEEIKEKPMKELTPAVITQKEPTRDIGKPSQNFIEESIQEKEKERNKAVQAYLDFFEASLLKLFGLAKTGFIKGKDLLEKFLKKN